MSALSPTSPRWFGVAAINRRLHRQALNVFLFIVLAHWVEHLVQAYQLSFTAAPPGGSAGVTGSHHTVLTDGRELAGTLRCSVGIPVATGAGAAREPSTVDVAAAAKAEAAGTGHQHGVDPVSAALLAIDGVVALAVVVLLLRRPPPQPSRPPS